MSNSSLATVKVPAYAGNYTKGRESKISEITIHHMAGKLTAEQCGKIFQTVGRKGSAHYGIGWGGTIAQYVDEANTAWANSNWESNSRAVTIEVSNSSTGGDWPVSDKTLNSLIKLVADIAKRNGMGTLVKGKNVTWHSMYAATACPGAYLLSKMDYIISEANKLNARKEVTPGVITGVDAVRYTDDLILYKAGTKGRTGTNQWGTEVALDKNFKAIANPVKGVGNMIIPEGGYVLSGHGKNSEWILNNITRGKTLKLSVSIKA